MKKKQTKAKNGKFYKIGSKFTSICCDCGLKHKVEIQIPHLEIKFIRLPIPRK